VGSVSDVQGRVSLRAVFQFNFEGQRGLQSLIECVAIHLYEEIGNVPHFIELVDDGYFQAVVGAAELESVEELSHVEEHPPNVVAGHAGRGDSDAAFSIHSETEGEGMELYDEDHGIVQWQRYVLVETEGGVKYVPLVDGGQVAGDVEEEGESAFPHIFVSVAWNLARRVERERRAAPVDGGAVASGADEAAVDGLGIEGRRGVGGGHGEAVLEARAQRPEYFAQHDADGDVLG